MSIFETEAYEFGETGFETGFETGLGEIFGEHEFGEVFGEHEFGEVFGEQEFGEVLGEHEFGEVFEQESPLNEMQEMELAAELLEIQSEEELEQFLGKLIKGAARAVGGIVKSPIGRALGGVLKNVAKTALPVVGGALGSMVAPGLGTALGSKLGTMASNLFEVELEGMAQEQAEFEVARRFVRLAATSARNAALAPPTAPPARVVRQAVTTAARRHAPGLVRGGAVGPQAGARRRYPRRHRPGFGGGQAYAGAQAYGQPPAPPGYGYNGDTGGNGSYAGYAPSFGVTRPRTGRWIRRGRKIVLYGV